MLLYRLHKLTGVRERGDNPAPPPTSAPPEGAPMGGLFFILHLLAFPFLRHSTFYISLQCIALTSPSDRIVYLNKVKKVLIFFQGFLRGGTMLLRGAQTFFWRLRCAICAPLTQMLSYAPGIWKFDFVAIFLSKSRIMLGANKTFLFYRKHLYFTWSKCQSIVD